MKSRGGAEAAAVAGQPGRGHHRQRRGDLVPDAAPARGRSGSPSTSSRLARSPASGSAFRSITRRLLARQQGMVERRGQDRRRAAVQRADPHPLGVAVMAVASRRCGRSRGCRRPAEVRGRVAGAGVAGRVGECLHRQHPVPVGRQVIGWQPPQHPGQHRRGQVRCRRPPAARRTAGCSRYGSAGRTAARGSTR